MKRIEDAPATDSFDPGRPDPGLAAKIGGPPMQAAESDGYEVDVDVGTPVGPTFEEALLEWRKHHGHKPKHSAGLIMFEPDERVWFHEPKDHFGGYPAVLPKGRLDEPESEQQAALREFREETGLTGEITGIVGSYNGDTGITTYYLARRTGGAPWAGRSDEVWSVKLARPEDAERVFRSRDRIALRDARALRLRGR